LLDDLHVLERCSLSALNKNKNKKTTSSSGGGSGGGDGGVLFRELLKQFEFYLG
jgi:hypothetical protein